MSYDLQDHPVIRNMELYGVPDPTEKEVHAICPICGSADPEDFFIIDGEIVGCSDCVKRVDAIDYACDHEEVASYD